MKVKDLNKVVSRLTEIIQNNDPEMEVAFTNPNCWRQLDGRKNMSLSTAIVEVKRHYFGYAPLSVINGKRGYMEDYTKELLAKPTLKVLHIEGI